MAVNVFDVVSARVSVTRTKGRLSGRFAGVVKPVVGTVIGPGLALVDGQMVNAAVTEEQIGASVVLQNAGRAAAAYYVPATGGGAVTANSTVSRGSAGSVTDGVPVTRRIDTVWPLQGGGALSQNLYLSFDGVAVGKPYATIVVAAVNSQAPQAVQADFVCDGVGDEEQVNRAIIEAAPGMVLLLDGAYNLSTPIMLASGIDLVGLGKQSVLVATSEAILGTDVTGVRIENMAIVGGIGNAIHIVGGEQVAIQNCYISGAMGLGIFLTTTTALSRAVVSGNHVVSCSSGGIFVAGLLE